jgi:D-glycero-D-manno-heptose 1,7-bisphosphate phosphatase
MNKAVFLDRDGVINRKAPEGEYVTRWEDMVFLPGVAEAIASLSKVGFSVIVVSNQRCVAKGLLTVHELESIHQRMRQELALNGAFITDIYYCPHEKEPRCSCRKPESGMLLAAAQEHDLDLKGSWMIGDSSSDVLAGKNAGCRTVRILNDTGIAQDGADVFAHSLLEAAQQILLKTSSPERVAS